MTSIPDRINKTWITIESLFRQTYKPDRIILWLSKEEFKNFPLPSALKTQQKRGLQIKYCDNLMSYKKIYYTAKENPNSYIVTVDDDIIYAENMLEELVRTYKQNQGCIICNRSHYMENVEVRYPLMINGLSMRKGSVLMESRHFTIFLLVAEGLCSQCL